MREYLTLTTSPNHCTVNPLYTKATQTMTFNSKIKANLSPKKGSPVVISMWSSCKVLLDEENPKYAGLAQENGFGSV
jgi:hypothetical protein